ncbi:MAG: response regulator [Vicinamibacterales bacterium]
MKKKLLVVEDDAALARVLCDNLSFAGFQVEWAPDGATAVRSVRTVKPDLILLDIILPDRSGFDLCLVLRGGARTPLVRLTARGQMADKVRGFELGADDYVNQAVQHRSAAGAHPGGAAAGPVGRPAADARRRRHRSDGDAGDGRRPRVPPDASRVRVAALLGRARAQRGVA